MAVTLEPNPPGVRIMPGQLAEKIQQVTQRALSSDALQPIGTRIVYAEEHGINFVIRKLDSLDKKHKASLSKTRMDAAGNRETNPFLPYEKDLYIGDLTDTHAVVLNKYHVVPRHLLMITRAFVSQQMLLDNQDMEAAWVCLRELDWLVFYNGGVTAGASQPHRHLQMVPLPMENGIYRFPTEPLLVQTVNSHTRYKDHFPFVYAVADIGTIANVAKNDPLQAARKTLEIYIKLLRLAGLPPDKNSMRQAGPYNMLMTRRLMMIVPRSNEHAHGISINALGFAGSLLVRNDEQLEKLKTVGPMRALEQVSVSRPESSR